MANLVHLCGSAWPGKVEDLATHAKARFMLRVERRLVGSIKSVARLGDPFFDPRINRRVHWLMFEVVGNGTQDGREVSKKHPRSV